MSLDRFKKLFFRNQHQLLILSILLIALTTRYFKLSQLLHWTMDEEYWSYVAHNVATFYHIPLIGGPAAGTGLYLGPLYVWLISPLFWVVNSNPLGIAFVVSSLGVITAYLIYKLLLSLLDKQTALLASIFYATSTLATLYDRKFWNATPIPILSLITIFLLPKVITKPTFKKILILAFTLSLAFHAHMTGLVLIALAATYLLLHQVSKNTLIKLILLFVLFQSPLILFEFRHGFTNTNAVLSLGTTSSDSLSKISILSNTSHLVVNTFSRFIYIPATDIANELTLCSQLANQRSIPPVPFKLLAIAVLFFAATKLREKNIFSLALFTNIGLLFLYTLIAPPSSTYPGQLSEYYLLPSLISFFVLFSQLTLSLFKKLPLIISTIVVLLIIINLHTTFNLTHSQGFSTKLQLVNASISQLQGKPFTLSVSGHPCHVYGFRYLFTLLKSEPTSSYLDPSFSWLYQHRLPHNLPTKHLMIDADSATIQIKDSEIQTN